MTDNITLPRAVAERIQNAMQFLVDALEFDHDIDALAALDAALAKPEPKPEPATEEQLRQAHRGRGVALLPHFRIGWREAERFHGIVREDGK
jgi:hypothetical protein